MTTPIKFGTDGWRAIIAEDFTFPNVRACAQSVADFLIKEKHGEKGLVIGYDTRFASEDFAQAAAEVVAANGIRVYLCRKAAPTPVVSFSVRAKKAAGAIVITASHNPAQWNGFKYKTEAAGSAPPEIIAQIEEGIPRILEAGAIKPIPLQGALDQGLIRYFDPAPAYLQNIRQLVGPERLDAIRQAGLKVLVDTMYGAGAGYLRRLLAGDATQLIELNGKRNPAFPGIQPEPIAKNLAKLMGRVKRGKAHVGLASDGDADRLGVVDEKGEFVTQLQVFALLALYLLEIRGERGPLIKTITTTSMIYRLGELYGCPVVETDVGFKYVGPEMVRHHALIGGEESGGYGFRDHIPERDSVLAGLYFLDLMVQTGKSPTQLLDYLYRKVGPHFYDRLDLHFPAQERGAIISRIEHIQPEKLAGSLVAEKEPFYGDDTLSGVRFTIDDGSWLLIRFSGTEPILRAYAEASSIEKVGVLLEEGRGLAGV